MATLDERQQKDPAVTAVDGVSNQPKVAPMSGGVQGLRRSEIESTADIVTFQAWAEPETGVAALPSRYDVREGDGVRYLTGHEAPGVGVAIDRSYAYSEAEARKLGERVILVDGAGQFGPLVDSQRQLYNLDHHDDCLRAFTLATCEQALVLVLKGLELDKGDWRILANEPDLDTVFAIWVLLNYRRLRQMGPEARDRIVPLLRLEGAIDANGLEIAEYCGLPHDELLAAKAQLDALFADEVAIKKKGDWNDGDLLAYTCTQLAAIDQLVYNQDDFDDFCCVEKEFGHVGIGANRVAVVCRDDSGIYDVERRLKQVWQDRLGIVALAKDDFNYTLRRSAALAAIDLHKAYERLNQYDPAVDGHPPEKRWGGSDDIGGSPRPTGTGLEPKEIVSILRLAYRPPKRKQRLGLMATAAGVAVALTAGATAACWGYVDALSMRFGPNQEAMAEAWRLIAGGGALVIAGLLGFAWLGRAGRAWSSGWRRPVATGWIALLPAVFIGGGLGGAWVPRAVLWDTRPLSFALAGIALTAMGLALIFPGIVHGRPATKLPTQLVRGRWFVSQPALISGLLYALTTVAFAWVWIAPAPSAIARLGSVASWSILGLGSLTVGVSAAMVRERSLSVWPAVLALFLGAVVRILVGLL